MVPKCFVEHSSMAIFFIPLSERFLRLSNARARYIRNPKAFLIINGVGLLYHFLHDFFLDLFQLDSYPSAAPETPQFRLGLAAPCHGSLLVIYKKENG